MNSVALMPLPTREKLFSQAFSDNTYFDGSIAVLSLYGGIKTAVEKGSLDLVLAAFMICVASICKCVVSYRKKKKEKSIHELEGCLEVLRGVLVYDNVSSLRITIHVPVENGTELEQLLEYIGGDNKKRRGRRFSAESGVIGVAYERKEAALAERMNSDAQAYITELVDYWKFTEEKAKECNPNTQSCYAFPILDFDENVTCIIFFDSQQQNVFDETRRTLIEFASVGIAKYIRRRYFA